MLALSGAFRSIGFSAYNSVAFADVDPGRMTPANTLMTTLQELGTGLGMRHRGPPRQHGDPWVGDAPPDTSPPTQRVAVPLQQCPCCAPGQVLRLPRSAGAVVTGRG